MKYINTRRKYTIVDGVLVPLVRGGADGDGDAGDEGNEGDEGDEGGDEDPPPKGKSVPQERVDSIVTREKARAARSATKNLLKELGFESSDELKEALGKIGEGDKKEKEDLTKEREKLQRDRSETDRLKSEAAQDRLSAKITGRLVLAGATPNKVEKIASMIDLSPDDEPDKDDIDEAIAVFKEEWPELFAQEEGEEDGETPPPGSNRTPGSDPGRQPKKKPTGSAKERATARLHDRHPELADKK